MAFNTKYGNLRRLLKIPNSYNIYDVTKIVKRNNAHLIDYSMKSLYEIPENIVNNFHVANASLWDNMLYYFHSGVQISYGDIIHDLRQVHPQLNEFKATKTIESIIKLLSSCKNVIEFTYPVEKENGKIDVINAYRVQHTLYKEPCIGGVRLSEKLSVADLKGLAALITFQNSNLNLPFGGSFGGIAINPSNYCSRDLRRIVTTYAIECAKHGFLDPAKDVFQPDLNLTSREMSWMTDSFQQTLGHNNVNSYAAVLGKPMNRKGLQNYNEAAAYAVYFTISNLLMDNEKMSVLNLTPNWSDKTYVIHGFGRVGQSIAQCFYNTGAKCVGIQERDGVAIFNSEGLNIPNLIQHYKEHKSILDFSDAQEYQSDVIGYCADILVLAGPHKTVHCFNVQSITSKIIVEAAFCAITPTAHKTLMSKNAIILPDIQVATGCQIAAYVEYLKNINHISFGQIGKEPVRSPDLINEEEMQSVIAEATGETIISPEDVVTDNVQNFNKLNKMRLNCDFNEGEIVKNVIETNIIRTIEETNETCEKYGLGMDLRMACYVSAIKRIVNAYIDTGKFDNFFYDELKH